MELISIAALIFIGVYSQHDCGWGYFETVFANNSTAPESPDGDSFEFIYGGSCMYYCGNYENHVDIDTLSFDEIKEECSEVERVYSANPDDCNSLNDLLFPSDYGYCHCPYCKCSTKNEDGDISTTLSYGNNGPQQKCANCTCSALLTKYGIHQMVYDCDELMEVDDVTTWNDFQCPPEKCVWENDDRKRNVGDYWWNKVGDSDGYTDNSLCTQFCYCSGKDGEICETGFDNITANDILFDAFMSDCGRYGFLTAV